MEPVLVCVQKMHLGRSTKALTARRIAYNDWFTLSGLPNEPLSTSSDLAQHWTYRAYTPAVGWMWCGNTTLKIDGAIGCTMSMPDMA